MRWQRTVGRYVAGVMVMVLVIMAGITIRIIHFSAGLPATATPASDVIVVLGAAQYNGQPSPVFQARLDHAAALYRDGVADNIVTVGAGQVGDRTTEAEAGRSYLSDQGIAAGDLVAVPQGHDTLVSLRAMAARAAAEGWRSVVVVTDPWHEQRCRMILRDLGMDVSTSPVTSGPATADSVEARYVWRELLGTIYYRLTGGSSGSGTPVM